MDSAWIQHNIPFARITCTTNMCTPLQKLHAMSQKWIQNIVCRFNSPNELILVMWLIWGLCVVHNLKRREFKRPHTFLCAKKTYCVCQDLLLKGLRGSSTIFFLIWLLHALDTSKILLICQFLCMGEYLDDHTCLFLGKCNTHCIVTV